MNRAFFSTLLCGVLLAVGACHSKTDEKAAIRDGVIKHIGGMNGLNVSNMDIVVTQATVNGSTAQANVDIRAKNGDPNAPAMQLVYQMQKQGAEWVVVKSQPMSGHPAPGEMPSGGDLPPGHPATGGASGPVQGTHDFNAILNSGQPQGQQAPAQQPATPPPAPGAQKPSSGGKP